MKFIKNLDFMLKFIWKHNKLWLFLCALTTLLSAVTPLINIVIPKYIVDSAFIEKDFALGMYWAIALICINLVVYCISSLLGYAAAKQKNKLFLSFNIYISELIMDMDYKDIENPETLNMKDRAMKSAFSGGRGFCGSVEVLFGIISNIIVFIGAVIKVTELNIFLILIILVVIILNTIYNKKTLKENYILDKEKVPIERKNSYVFNLINDFSIGKEVRLYKLKGYITEKYKETSEESNVFYNKAFFNNTKNGLFSGLTANIQLLVIYFILLLQVFQSTDFTYGDFTAQFAAVNTLSSSLLAIVTSVLAINQMGFYIDDLISFLNLPKKSNDKGLSIPESSVYEFDFVNVSFKYPGSDVYALRDINLHFTTDQKISMVGLNGSGKTTFVKLLLRLYDVSSGEILLNGNNIQKYCYNDYIKIFSSVFQDYKLFAYSVLENIAFADADENLDGEKLRKALCESGVDEFLKEKDRGIDAFVYKIFDITGFEPSGGEGQKIAIARALYKDSKFVILDEPTSALDPIAEYNLYEKLNNMVNDKGCLFISHRLSSTVSADNIFVFENGSVVEQGTHKELMNHSHGLYKDMFEKQASHYIET